MKRLAASIALLLALLGSVKAAEQIELFIAVTNTPVTGDELTINATTRTWTNAHSSATILTNLTPIVINYSATNLYFNLSAYFITELPIVRWAETNQLRLIFRPGVAVTASESGNWASITYTTNNIATARGVRVPITVEAATNQTNIATLLVEALQYSTTAIDEAWVVGSNLAALSLNNAFTGTNSLAQGGWNRGSITNLLALSGIMTRLTNGYGTNQIFDAPKFTNAVNYGNPFSSPGAFPLSEQFGSNASATAVGATAIGNTSLATNQGSIAVGGAASSLGNSAIAIGVENYAGGDLSIAIGAGSTVHLTAHDGIAIGSASNVGAGETNSMAFGNFTATTETNQIMLGASTHKVRIPGRIEPTGTITNAILTGYGSFGISGGPYAYPVLRRYNNTALANGNNAGVVPGDAAYMKVSGPSAAFTINGITNWTDGRLLIVQNSTTFDMTIANDSGTDPQAGNRILTGTGADITVTNSPGSVTLLYDSAVSRWIITAKTD